MKILLATGNHDLDKELEGAFSATGIATADPVYYREALQLETVLGGIEAVVLSPALNGSVPIHEVIYSLRKNDIRVVLLSGDNSDELRQSAIGMGVYDIIEDPVQAKDVVSSLLHPATFATAVGFKPLGAMAPDFPMGDGNEWRPKNRRRDSPAVNSCPDTAGADSEVKDPVQQAGNDDVSSIVAGSGLETRQSGPAVSPAVKQVQTPSATHVRVLEKLVAEQRPIGLVTVAVAGTFTGAGCTHMALAVSHFIARAGHKVILAGRPNGESLGYNSIVHVLEGRESGIEGCATVCGMDIFFESSKLDGISDIFSRFQGRGYEYLVLDMGCLDLDARQELDRSGLPILVTSASCWRLHHLATMVKYNYDGMQNWTVVANMASEFNYQYFCKMFQDQLPKVQEMPFFPDLFNPDETTSEHLSRLLAPVLPGQARRRKRGWLPR
jgi:hypothetical protein